jgi:hypothetical protein
VAASLQQGGREPMAGCSAQRNAFSAVKPIPRVGPSGVSADAIQRPSKLRSRASTHSALQCSRTRLMRLIGACRRASTESRGAEAGHDDVDGQANTPASCTPRRQAGFASGSTQPNRRPVSAAFRRLPSTGRCPIAGVLARPSSRRCNAFSSYQAPLRACDAPPAYPQSRVVHAHLWIS